MTFREEVETLGDISTRLLRRLDPEPDYVKSYIERECGRLKEEGWFEQQADRPWARTFERGKYILRVAFIHARKGEHITGADLAFELKDKKIVFVQSKRVGSNERINFNRFQLQKLTDLEAQIWLGFLYHSPRRSRYWLDLVRYFYREPEDYYGGNYLRRPFLPFLEVSKSPFPVAFYHLVMRDDGCVQERFFHILEVSFTLGGSKSASQKEFLNQGLKDDDFHRMFWECKIGAPDIREEMKREVLYLYSLYTDRLVIWSHVEEK